MTAGVSVRTLHHYDQIGLLDFLCIRSLVNHLLNNPNATVMAVMNGFRAELYQKLAAQRSAEQSSIESSMPGKVRYKTGCSSLKEFTAPHNIPIPFG